MLTKHWKSSNVKASGSLPLGNLQSDRQVSRRSFSDGKLLINVFQGARLKVFETDPHKSEWERVIKKGFCQEKKKTQKSTLGEPP